MEDLPDNEDGSWAVPLHPPRLLEVAVVVLAEPRVVVADAVAAPVQPIPRAEKPSTNDTYRAGLKRGSQVAGFCQASQGIGNSSNKIHQTWCTDFSRSLYTVLFYTHAR